MEQSRCSLPGSSNCHVFPSDHRGLAIEDLRTAAKQWARSIGEGEKPERAEIPQLALEQRRFHREAAAAVIDTRRRL